MLECFLEMSMKYNKNEKIIQANRHNYFPILFHSLWHLRQAFISELEVRPSWKPEQIYTMQAIWKKRQEEKL